MLQEFVFNTRIAINLHRVGICWDTTTEGSRCRAVEIPHALVSSIYSLSSLPGSPGLLPHCQGLGSLEQSTACLASERIQPRVDGVFFFFGLTITALRDPSVGRPPQKQLHGKGIRMEHTKHLPPCQLSSQTWEPTTLQRGLCSRDAACVQPGTETTGLPTSRKVQTADICHLLCSDQKESSTEHGSGPYFYRLTPAIPWNHKKFFLEQDFSKKKWTPILCMWYHGSFHWLLWRWAGNAALPYHTHTTLGHLECILLLLLTSWKAVNSPLCRKPTLHRAARVPPRTPL